LTTGGSVIATNHRQKISSISYRTRRHKLFKIRITLPPLFIFSNPKSKTCPSIAQRRRIKIQKSKINQSAAGL
jgi:hypothetical protein